MFGRLGVEVVMPKPDEIDFIHNSYLDVVYDRSTPEKIDRLRALANTLVRRDGAEVLRLLAGDRSLDGAERRQRRLSEHRLRRRAHQGDHAAAARNS